MTLKVPQKNIPYSKSHLPRNQLNRTKTAMGSMRPSKAKISKNHSNFLKEDLRKITKKEEKRTEVMEKAERIEI